jgi:hypothetical protein
MFLLDNVIIHEILCDPLIHYKSYEWINQKIFHVPYLLLKPNFLKLLIYLKCIKSYL